MASLFERFRPSSLADVVGQEDAIRQIRAVLARGWGGRAWWITGASGTGKTTIARILALEGAEEYAVEELDAQNLTPAKCRDIEHDMRFRMLGEKTGKAYIVNEAHGLRRDTIRQLLVMLERLPEHVVWVFTTTKAGEAKLFDDDDSGDASPLLSRCIEITLSSSDATHLAFAQLAQRIARAENIDGLPLDVYRNAVAGSKGNLRRVLQRIESGLFKADALTALEREYGMIASTKGERAERRRAELQAAIAAAKS